MTDQLTALIAFINARLDELERAACAAGGEAWCADTRDADDGQHAIVRQDSDVDGVDVIARCGLVGLEDGERAAARIALNDPQSVLDWVQGTRCEVDRCLQWLPEGPPTGPEMALAAQASVMLRLIA